ncbi:MAG: HNH endonuclease signature motif containing protein [bacterium]|nr:HNH endonuclease signature motif containing protein [bacterium]
MISEMTASELAEVFQYKDSTRLSFAIILSALSIAKPGKYLPIENFRSNPFSELWRHEFHHGSNWTAQYRSELNQGDGRLAHRVFESPNGTGHEYRLKDLSGLAASDTVTIEEAQRIISAIERGESVIDTTDEMFQTAVRIADPIEPLPEGPIAKPRKQTKNSSTGYRGNPRIAKLALILSGNLCTYDPSHKTFFSPTLEGQYVEMHHIIPISNQEDFPHSIDVPVNIVPLCPNCHRKIHNAEDASKSEMLKKLYTGKVIKELRTRGVDLTLEVLLNYYR